MPLCLLIIFIIILLAISFPMYADSIKHWYISPITAALLIMWIIIAGSQPRIYYKTETKKVTIVDETAVIKLNDLVNLNKKIGKQYNEGDEIVVKHPQNLYAGILYELQPVFESKKNEQETDRIE